MRGRVRVRGEGLSTKVLCRPVCQQVCLTRFEAMQIANLGIGPVAAGEMTRRDWARYDDMRSEAGSTHSLPLASSSRGRAFGWSEHVVVVYGADSARVQVLQRHV